jgi:phytoene synthase
MCDARVFDLYDDPMPDRTSYEGYAGETASALLQMSAFLIDPDASAQTATASGHAGVAQAVAGHLTDASPFPRRGGRSSFLVTCWWRPGSTATAFLNGERRCERVANAVRAFAGFGRDHLDKARRALRDLPASARPAYLPVALVEPVLAQGRARLAPGVWSTSVRHPQWRRQWQLWRAARSGHLTVFNDTRFIWRRKPILAQGFCDALRSVGLSGIVSYR